MELNLERKTVSFCQTVYDGAAEQIVDSDITLPDYCKDITRVLKCSVTPGIRQVQTTGNRVTAEGVAVIRLCYTGENNELCSFEQSCPFTKYVEIPAMPDNPVISVRAKTEYVNCRAVSPRRVDVHASVSLNFTVTKTAEESIVCGCTGDGVQTRLREFTACSAAGCAEKTMPMSEIAEIPADKPAVKSIVRATPLVRIDDIKVVGNKLLIKGDLTVTLVYCGENGELSRFEHIMPISQIAEIDGVGDDCTFEIRPETVCLDVQMKADGNGEMRLCDISASLCAVICGYRDVEGTLVDDAYSVSEELVLGRKSMELMRLVDSIEDVATADARLDFTGNDISHVLDSWCSAVTCVPNDSGSEMRLGGTLTLCIIYVDSEGQPGYAERQCDYEYRRRLDKDYPKLCCRPFARVSGLNVSGSGASLRAKAEISVSALVFECGNDRIISEIGNDSSVIKTSPSAAVTIYFPDNGESVWDIAKKYNTTPQCVMSTNGLDGDTVGENMMLLIPKK